MTFKLNEEELQKIREIRITRILGIKDNGGRISICCPVHAERTPSFSLYGNNSFYCFGCNVYGSNAIDFVQALGYSFVEAINELKQYL